MRLHILLLALGIAVAILPARAGESIVAAESGGAITLRQAVALALLHHPELAVYSKDIRITDARRLQASLRPNPALGFTAEDVLGSGPYEGIDQAQHTLELSQLFELGGKREARVRAAALGRELAQWDYETKRLEISARTVDAFVDVLGAQRRLAQAKETLGLAEQFAPAAQRRVEAGRASPVEVTRANVATATSRIAVEQQQGQLAVARKRLAAQWGSTKPRFSEAVGDLDRVRDLPSLAAATRRLERNPQLARRESELAQREAQLASERAKARPDLTVSGGVRHFNDTNDGGIVLDFSLPLPLFNRNQGGIAEAQIQIEKARAQGHATRVQLNTVLAIAYEQMEDAKIQITTYRESVLPQVEEAYKLTNEGYQTGRFSYLEMLDARRSMAEARLQYLEALIRYHKAVAEIEGLTGQAVSTPTITPRSQK